MRQLEPEVSPIQHKHPRRLIYCSQMGDRIDMAQNPHHLTVIDTLNWSQIEQRIVTAAKTIVYLFTPEVDLLQSIENNIVNYDKYQKTRLILRELVSTLHEGRFEVQTEILKTHEQMQKMEAEISYFKVIVNRLEQECIQKEQNLEQQRKVILQLTEDYKEAKRCFEEELSELKERSQEFRINIRGRQRSKENKEGKTSRELQTLKVSKKRRESDAYTDRSMYKRVTAVNMEGEAPLKSNRSQQSPQSTYLLKIEHLQFQKQTLERKLAIVEEEFKQLAGEYSQAKEKLNQNSQGKIIQVEKCQEQIALLRKKLMDKNRIIEDLLAVVEGKT